MTIVGFNFSSIEVKRESAPKGQVNVSNNVAIKDIEETKFPIGKEKQTALKFSFEFTSKYEPKIGNVTLGGSLLFIAENEKVKKVLEEWKKDKSVAADIMKGILNTILAKGNILALILSQEVNLPPPIPLPKVNVQEKPKDKK